MSKDTKQIIRELVEEVIEEMTTSGAAGPYMTKFAFGKGDRTKKIAGRSMPGGTVVGSKESDETSVEEGEDEEDGSLPIIRKDLKVMEEGRQEDMTGEMCQHCGKGTYQETTINDDLDGKLHCTECGDEIERYKPAVNEGRSRYRNFRESDLMKNHAKISYGINQAKKMLSEVEYLVEICERLKTECGYNNDNLWKRTRPDMVEIHRRLKEIAKRINRMGKS